MALQCKDADQILDRITDISTGRGLLALRHPVEMLQTHRVVDQQSACMSHVCAQELNKAAISLFSQCARMKRRQSPVLAGWVVDVGWRADLGRRYHRSG